MAARKAANEKRLKESAADGSGGSNKPIGKLAGDIRFQQVDAERFIRKKKNDTDGKKPSTSKAATKLSDANKTKLSTKMKKQKLLITN